MSNTGLIQRAAFFVHRLAAIAGRGRAQARRQEETLTREVELLLDDLAFNGVDVNTEGGKTIMWIAVQEKFKLHKAAAPVEEYEEFLW